jgi:putative copper resistance protein D
MGPDLPRLFTILLDLAVAVLAGAGLARCRLVPERADAASGWAAARLPTLRRVTIAAAALALAANALLLWCESAAMAEVPLLEAAGATWSMLSATHLGLAWCIGMTGLAAAAALKHGRGTRWPASLSPAALGVFWYARAMTSHAAGEGDFSLRLLADAVHLGATAVWVGEVVLAIVVLRGRAMDVADRRARAAYVAGLSLSATLALAAILVTGLYTAWRNLGGFGNLFGNSYCNILVAKLLLVAVAAILGGVNRYFVMPAWLAHESAGEPAPERSPARFRRILRVEGAVLLAAVAAAAWLASTSPPGDVM